MSIALDIPKLEGTLLSQPLAKLHAAPKVPLLLLLHGGGANERDLVPFAKDFASDFSLAFLRAPFEKAEKAYYWTQTASGAADSASNGTQARSAAASAAAIEDWLATSGLDVADRPIALLGFSGGAATALQLLRRRPSRYRATALLSGFLTDDDQKAPWSYQPHVHWSVDPLDKVVGDVTIARTRAWLDAHTALDEQIFPDTGHRVHEDSIAAAAAFLRANLAA